MKILEIPLPFIAILLSSSSVALSIDRNGSKAPSPYIFGKKASAPLQSKSKPDYVFKANSGGCIVKPNEICKAVWIQHTVPAENSSPTTTAVWGNTTVPGESAVVPLTPSLK